MIKPKLLLPLLLSPSAFATDQAPTVEELRYKVLVETRIVVVDKLVGPASEYRSDSDPDTLEIVMLPRGDVRPSWVSDDGEVIFDNSAPDEEKAALMEQAIEIRVQRRLAGT